MFKITTANSLYRNNECVGGYNEVHKINSLQNVEHVVATVQSIIDNNKKFDTDTKLETITITINKKKKELAKKVDDYYINNQIDDIKVYVEIIDGLFTYPVH